MSLAPGSQIGPYQIVESIGSGGMGEVFKARDTRLGRDVAIKLLNPQRVNSSELRQRFRQEARAASALNHPNIVTIYDIGSDGETEYIAMEYIQGRTLGELIQSQGLPLREVLKIAVPVSEALASAHASGMIHRDLKPANIMIGGDGRVKLLDFGLAKLTDRNPASQLGDEADSTRSAPVTVEGAIVGTVSYMSPEQAEGLALDVRSDIFSFGVVLYEMVTGRRAFQAGSTISTLSSILKDDPQRPSEISGEVSPELEHVIARCLRKDREQRWPSMNEVAARLAELKTVNDSGILLAAAVPAAAKPRRTLPVIVASMIVGILLVSSVLWVALLRQASVSPPASGTSVAATAAEPAQPDPKQPIPTAPKPKRARIASGQKILLQLDVPLSSSTAREGQRVAFTVVSAVRSGSTIVIAAGAKASGTVVDAARKRLFRRTPKLSFRFDMVDAVDGKPVKLRAASAVDPSGKQPTVIELPLSESSTTSGNKQSEISADEGARFLAYADEDRVIELE